MKKLFLILFLFILSACSAPIDCSTKDSTYKKYSYDESSKECVVSKTIQRDVCGNNVIEEGEDYCNCAKDVSKTHPKNGCSGNVGEYVELACNTNNECVEFKLEDSIVTQNKKVTFKNTDLTFEGTFGVDVPIVIATQDSTKLPLDLELFKTSSSFNVRNIVVDSIALESSSGVQFSSLDYNSKVASSGDRLPIKSFSVEGISSYSSKQKLNLIMKVSYIKETLNRDGEIVKSENKIESLKAVVGTFEVINPKFFDK